MPLHIGNGITLTPQNKNFKTESNKHILKLHKKETTNPTMQNHDCLQ